MKTYLYLALIAALSFTGCQKEKVAIAPKTIAHIDTAGSGISFMKNLHKRRTIKSYDQTLAAYLQSTPVRPDSVRKVIYLLPLGDMDTLVMNILKNEAVYLEKFFQLEVKMMPGVPFDDLKKINKVKTRMITGRFEGKGKSYIEGNEEQIEANSLKDKYIIPNMPTDAVAVIGVTSHDLYNPEYNYIFGTSSLTNRTGIVSVHRLMGYDPTMNIRKVVSKQVANMFSIPNVKDYDCLLNFHNNSDALEQGTTVLSPLALQKLKVAIGFDYKKRFESLQDFWKSEGNEDIAAYYDNCLKVLNK